MLSGPRIAGGFQRVSPATILFGTEEYPGANHMIEFVRVFDSLSFPNAMSAPV